MVWDFSKAREELWRTANDYYASKFSGVAESGLLHPLGKRTALVKAGVQRFKSAPHCQNEELK